MLVLSRKPNESIRIGEGVVITVLAIRGNAVRIGVDAPKDIQILRTELTNANRRRKSDSVRMKAGHPNPSTRTDLSVTTMSRAAS